MTKPDYSDPSAEQWVRFLAALECECGECDGTGQVRSAEWRAWHERANELFRVAQAAHRAADLSHASQGGQGQHPEAEVPTVVMAVERAINEHMRARPDEPEQMPCQACRGTGRVLSAVGLQLVELLARHGFVREGGA
ncbi:MAG: hypothetical protein IRY90_18945 [Actinomadura rubrobrunea]|nr:hypothetical protein [Actinomadura rubrobrunea]